MLSLKREASHCQVTHMQKISESTICGLKSVKTRGRIFDLPDFYLSSSVDFTVLLTCRINCSHNFAVGNKML